MSTREADSSSMTQAPDPLQPVMAGPTPGPVPPTDSKKTGGKRLGLLTTLAGYLFVLPTLVFVATFTLLPLALALNSSLRVDKRVDPYAENGRFVGLGVYAELFNDPVFTKMLGNTAVFIATTVPASLVLAFGLVQLPGKRVRK